MKSSTAKIAFRLTLLVGLFSLQSVVFATNIAVSPPTLEFSVESGSTFEGELLVYGSDSQDLRIRVSLRDWVLDQEGRAAQPEEESFWRSAAPWVKIEPEDMIVPAGESRIVKVSGVVPSQLTAGDYWTGYYIEFRPLSVPQTTGVVVVPAIWGSITLSVAGEVEKRGKIVGLEVGWSEGKDWKGVSGKIIFVNESAAILKPVGKVEIRSLAGETIVEFSVPSVKVLPDAKREIPFEGELNLEAGRYLALAIIDYGGERLVAAQALLNVAAD